MKINYIATDANGLTHTRSTKSRSYTHMVVIKRSYDAAIAAASDRHWAKTDASNFDYYLRIAEGRSSHYPSTRYCPQYPERYDAAAIADEEARLSASDAAKVVEAKAVVEGHTVASYVAQQLAKRLARVEALKAEGYYDRWCDAGWCGRLDLAHKLAGSQKNVAATAILAAVEA